MRATTALLLLPALVSAHFTLDVPAGRGDSGKTQDQKPCGGLGPSKTRTPFPLSGAGQIQFEAGHESAETYVKIAIGVEDPKEEDFKVVLKDTFNQIGYGAFCWDTLDVDSIGAKGLEGVKNGTVATIQVVQGGHGSALYNCADVILVDDYTKPSACSNATGISAEPISTSGGHGHGSDHSDDDEEEDTKASGNATAPAAEDKDAGSAAGRMNVVGGLLVGSAVAAAAFVLGF